MPGLSSILMILGFLAAGFAARLLLTLPRWWRRTDRLIQVAHRATRPVLWALLTVMGWNVGSLMVDIRSVGGTALLLAACATLGSVGMAVPALAFRRRLRTTGTVDVRAPAPANGGRSAPGRLLRSLVDPLVLMAWVLFGFAIARGVPNLNIDSGSAIGGLLNILVFLVGMDLAGQRLSVRTIVLDPVNLLLPLATVAGTIVGAGLAALVCHRPGLVAAAAGFGWYSLSGVLISQLGDAELGAVAFLSNILRESFALLSIPWIARTRFPEAGIAAAGATSMDVCLPVIEQTAGARFAPLAVLHGSILSLLVPVLTPFLFGLSGV